MLGSLKKIFFEKFFENFRKIFKIFLDFSIFKIPNIFSGASDTLSLAPSCCDEGDHSSAPDDKLDKLSLLSDSADSGFGGGVFRAVAVGALF